LPRTDISESGKAIEITAELPGLEKMDVELNVADNLLTIRGEKRNEREEKNKDYHLVERLRYFLPFGRTSRRRQARGHLSRDRQWSFEGHGTKANTETSQADRDQDSRLSRTIGALRRSAALRSDFS
jgi:hypothetical protein